jgi:hypothetical protein
MDIAGLTIFYIVFGFFTLVLIIVSIVILVLWKRRKLIRLNFLADTGMWEGKWVKPTELEAEKKGKKQTFTYDGETYKFDIKKCTHDRINRPVGHWYKGNPEQCQFDYDKTNKAITISGMEITAKDFSVLMLSKVLRDIFQDEEVMQWLLYILIAVIVMGVISSIVTFTHNPACQLDSSNETLKIIAQGVRQGILNK